MGASGGGIWGQMKIRSLWCGEAPEIKRARLWPGSPFDSALFRGSEVEAETGEPFRAFAGFGDGQSLDVIDIGLGGRTGVEQHRRPGQRLE